MVSMPPDVAMIGAEKLKYDAVGHVSLRGHMAPIGRTTRAAMQGRNVCYDLCQLVLVWCFL
jgi:hypothetical protein